MSKTGLVIVVSPSLGEQISNHQQAYQNAIIGRWKVTGVLQNTDGTAPGIADARYIKGYLYFGSYLASVSHITRIPWKLGSLGSSSTLTKNTNNNSNNNNHNNNNGDDRMVKNEL
jgi:hypothetical protein